MKPEQKPLLSKMSLKFDLTNKPSQETPITLFVGCLDPSTTEIVLKDYFTKFFSKLSVKLLFEKESMRFKQCALVTVYDSEAVKSLLKEKHSLLGRNIRVDYACEDKKGKKPSQKYQIQVSSIPPTTPLEDVQKAFKKYPGVVKVIFVAGIHAKQKKVAVVTFDNPESFGKILKETHFRINDKNCKVAEYIPKNQTLCPAPHPPISKLPSPSKSSQSVFSKDISDSYSTFTPSQFSQNPPRKGLALKKLNLEALTPPVLPRTPGFLSQPPADSPRQPTRKLSSSNQYVHPVEVENDSLFKIFCEPDLESPAPEGPQISRSKVGGHKLGNPLSIKPRLGSSSLAPESLPVFLGGSAPHNPLQAGFFEESI